MSELGSASQGNLVCIWLQWASPPTRLWNTLQMPVPDFWGFCSLRYFVIGRGITRIGSVGISVKKNNVLPALSAGWLHGLYKDWDESIENKESRGGRSGLGVGEATALLVPKITWSVFLPKQKRACKSLHNHDRHLTLCKLRWHKGVPNAEVRMRLQTPFWV